LIQEYQKRWSVNRLKHGLAIFACWAALLFHVHGQSLPEWLSKTTASKPPDFGILDRSGVFHRDSGTFKRISELIRQMEQDHDYQIYLVVEPVLIAASAPEMAAELRQAWVPDGNGLVVVIESDSRHLGIGRELTGSAENPLRVPSHELTALLNRALEAADSKLATEAYIENLMEKLTGELNGYFKRRATPPPAYRSVKFGLLVAGTLALLGLAAIGLGGLVRHSSMARVRSFRFPTVDRPERVGAPCGANVTARRFARPRSPGA
jgi:Txe/YoeB family toxin of Txe-Axe toxin-antitoxin module